MARILQPSKQASERCLVLQYENENEKIRTKAKYENTKNTRNTKNTKKYEYEYENENENTKTQEEKRPPGETFVILDPLSHRRVGKSGLSHSRLARSEP